MKIISLFVFFIFSLESSKSQQGYADSLHHAIQSVKEDSDKIFTLSKLSDYYSFLYPDSSLYYAEKIIELSRQKKYAYGEALGFMRKGEALDRVGDYPLAFEMALHSLDIAKTLSAHQFVMMGEATGLIAHLNSITGYAKESLPYFHESNALLQQSGEHKEEIYYNYFRLAITLLNLDKPDSAIFYIKKGSEFLSIVKTRRNPTPWLIMGNIYNSLGKIDTAEHYYREGIKISEEYNALFIKTVLYNELGGIFYQQKKKDSCIYYVEQSLLLSQKYKYKLFEIYASGFLSHIYDPINTDSTLKYMKIMLEAKDQAFSEAKIRQFQLLRFENEKKQIALENARAGYQNKMKMYALITALFVFLIIAFIFWRNNKQKQKANIFLKEQKEKVENTLAELKSTQAQLIQSEKMASLGELTAGIAHEIQNPLNFVNNFSEVNRELIEEMKGELQSGNNNEAISIANNISENEEKINYHGKRADAIVKGMLQHSRSSSATKEPTDINKLADEYLRLAYHGLRAKDKSLNATLKTDFDEKIGNIHIIPQDIGRVILNLITNSFYVLAEKKKQNIEGYEPTVSVSTKKINGNVEIKVIDNGSGIPEKILDKIFQPFFTTKPTGQGTGLGLSLSYDIIKAHGGELKVETKEREGSQFIIILPA